ncbi:n-terminal domain protein [Ichthyophthirius multifiliis]|uniref:N-terminal domain protein n=1 Tax=Ichthyophthirius multifiliis TaxID=5932 RepID=G0QMJ2_ICHMU|nr:n-terminal domain protein [Ichthyophthirius multifiliis]EGR33558.1 n-terminal domain protein [Ichthyophthirius multifiliis]|eukprot:XP_004037544.1 n-terminal domain protein [Ichthyophthirius multifiliis]
MDLYMEKTLRILENNDIHLLGVTCFFISCKFEEIYPVTIKIIEEKISHKKLNEKQIKEMEADVLLTLNFNLLGCSIQEIAIQTLTLLNFQEKLSQQEFSYVNKMCVYFSKMVLFDYELIKVNSYQILAAAILYIIFKVVQQINQFFLADQNVYFLLFFYLFFIRFNLYQTL